MCSIYPSNIILSMKYIKYTICAVYMDTYQHLFPLMYNIQMRPTSTIKPKTIPLSHQKKTQAQNNETRKQTFKDKKTQQERILQKRRPLHNKHIQQSKEYSYRHLPFNCFCLIVKFTTSTPFQVLLLAQVCLPWRKYLQIEDGYHCWTHLKGFDSIKSYVGFRREIESRTNEHRERLSVQFEKMYVRLFNYGSTKENIPNKLITKLDLTLRIEINSTVYPNYPFKVRCFNFSSYIYCKVDQLSAFRFDLAQPHNMFKDPLHIRLLFASKRYHILHAYSYKLIPTEIVECAMHTKAFNYFIDKNIVIPYFEGDDRFLYFFFEVSAIELLNEIRKALKAKHNLYISKEMKKQPLYKQLAQTQFQDFAQYFRYQSDFQVHMSYHNSQRQIFTHCDTKVYPTDVQPAQAHFKLTVNDSFERVPTFLLDNKQGMSERVKGLFLLDFILKDRDRFLIAFSGFVYAVEATPHERAQMKDYLSYSEYPVYLLKSKLDKYEIEIVLIEEPKRNFIRDIVIRMYGLH